jgi:hypothetical protein
MSKAAAILCARCGWPPPAPGVGADENAGSSLLFAGKGTSATTPFPGATGGPVSFHQQPCGDRMQLIDVHSAPEKQQSWFAPLEHEVELEQ